MARLVSPAEFGTFAIAQGISEASRAMGSGPMTEVAIQSRAPESIPWRFIQRLAFRADALAFCISLLATITAGLLESTVVYPLGILSIRHAFDPLTNLAQRRLQTLHEFRTLRLREFAGELLCSLVTIGCAWQGLGASAYSLGFVCAGIPLACLHLRPQFLTLSTGQLLQITPKAQASEPNHLRFGISRSASLLIAQGAELARSTLARSLIGAAEFGIFHRGFGLPRMLLWMPAVEVIQSIRPVLTRLKNNSLESRTWQSKTISASVLAFTAVAFFIHEESENLVHIILGDMWHESATYMKPIALATLLQATSLSIRTAVLNAGFSKMRLGLDSLEALGPLALLPLIAFVGPLSYLYGVAAFRLLACLISAQASVRSRILAPRPLLTATISSLLAYTSALALTKMIQQLPIWDNSRAAELLISAASCAICFGCTFGIMYRQILGEALASLKLRLKG